MSRPRNIVISESIRSLELLLTEAIGTRNEKKLRFLLLLKKFPDASIEELAIQSGLSKRTASRVIRAYNDGGVISLKTTASHSSARSPREEARDQRDSLRHAESLPDANQAWSDDQRTLLQLMSFVASAPKSTDATEWLIGMRAGLLELFPDVDHIVAFKVTDIDLFSPTISSEDVYFRESIEEEAPRTARQQVRAAAHLQSSNDGVGWKKILADGVRENRLDFAQFQAPEGRDYFYSYEEGETYIGSLLLFRKVGLPPISAETLWVLDAIEPLIVRLMAEAAARRQVRFPGEGNHLFAFDIVDPDRKLTEQERKVLIGHTTGHNTRQISEMLNISEETVKTHTQSILRKTGMRSIKNLIGRLVSPRQRFGDEKE